MGAKRWANSKRSKAKSDVSNSTRVRKRFDSSSPCSSLDKMLPPGRKMNSAIEATTPLRSGQETRRMAELCIGDSVGFPRVPLCPLGFKNFFTTEDTEVHREIALLFQRLRNLARGVSAGAEFIF